MSKRKYLPRLPSAGILLALCDLEKLEQTPGYTIDMRVWMVKWRLFDDNCNQIGKTCAVCLAGSVMANTLGIEPALRFDRYHAPYSESILLPEVTRDKLLALDSFREGNATDGVDSYTGGKSEFKGPNWAITPYESSPSEFKRDMRALVVELQAQGL